MQKVEEEEGEKNTLFINSAKSQATQQCKQQIAKITTKMRETHIKLQVGLQVHEPTTNMNGKFA